MSTDFPDTIAAIATPLGRGGVGIIRLSGDAVESIAPKLLGELPRPRKATHTIFLDEHQQAIDSGLALYFPAPHSFTGESVLELQGHGGPVVMDSLLQRVLACGARIANPGEFSLRAFLNNKIDLSQAEAIADLIDAQSTEAAKSAVRSLQGEFSKKIKALVEQLIALRLYVEAAIDFPEEEIDFLSDQHIADEFHLLHETLKKIIATAKQGVLLREGMTIVLAGKPNAGKSSLLNVLSGRESAIVTEIPGTTRDVLREHIQIDGIPLHIIDTAGLRESDDIIEQEGVRRAIEAMQQADVVVFLNDKSQSDALCEVHTNHVPKNIPIVFVHNKIDLLSEKPCVYSKGAYTVLELSVKKGEGIDLLKETLKKLSGAQTGESSQFIARRRHVEALRCAKEHLDEGYEQLHTYKAGELLAEELRLAQNSLNEITGEFSSEDLLGRIFSSFCIGK
jgi:tRNA modification GTPase